ncbi:hypothetical protein JKF63_02598 [Porcisia hertigi]|uniref:Uncharacterized protein n=1 Tax=Porcisia hertigi TaxID=2761500 RepID=A0A836L3Z0_9TRYP|nr:hypothetical protein JKF63_02598 [Porcisia hertigi]
MQRDMTQLPAPLLPEFPSTTSAAVSPPASDATTPAAASAISSAKGLARYFHGIAAGDDMTELIRGLRSSMWRCYQDCLQPPTWAQMLAASASTSQAAIGVGASADGAVDASSCGHDASLIGSEFEGVFTQCTKTMRASERSEAGLTVSAPAIPRFIPADKLKAADRRQYWLATKAAMLFSVEAPWAAEEATALHCCTVTRSLLYNYYYPSESRQDAPSRKPHVGATLGAAPAMSTLQNGEVRWVLSDTRVVEIAKEELRANRCDGGDCGWKRALALLRQVDPTPLTSAVELELYRRTDGHHWAEALRCLWRIEPTRWTEVDVAAAMRCLYSAGRRHHHQQRSSGSYATSSLFQARLIAHAFRIHNAVEAAGLLRWSTPSTLNDTLGLIAFDSAGWHHACILLDKLLASAAAGARLPDRDSSKGSIRGVADVVQGKKAVCSMQCITGAEETSEGDTFLLSTFYDRAIASQSDGGSTTSSSAKRASSPESLYHLVRANAVTVHQTCRAFQSRWDEGLRYVQLLQNAFVDTINLPSDIAATEDVLRLCIAGQQWEAALRLVSAHQLVMADDAEKRRLSPVMQHGSLTSAASRVSAAAAVVAPKRATLPHQRQHYSPDVFLQLVRLLGSVQASRYAAYDLVCRYAASTAASSSADVNVDGGHSIAADLRLSKHYSTDPIARAYNFLLQSADTLHSAEQVLVQLRNSRSPSLQGPVLDAQSSKGDTGSEASRQFRDRDAGLAGLETESVAHLAYLSAVAGNWCRALHHANALLHEPRYSATFFPTARLHDAVQYALERAPSPGPSWRVSVQLFADMMDRNVPSSEVSFQSVVKRCFTDGAPDQAQRLFHFVLRRGVRS